MSALGDQNPIDNPQWWDKVLIAGVLSPGVIKDGSLEEWKRAHDWDVKKGKGTKGGVVTFTNAPPAEGSIIFYLWEPEHFAAWDDFLQALKYDPTKKAPQAVSIYHPALDAIDVASVVTTKIGNLKHEGKQLYSIQIDFLEYFPPPNIPAVGTPTGDVNTTTSDPTTAALNNPQTAEEKQIAALASQAAAL
jgi:hypothetical protein